MGTRLPLREPEYKLRKRLGALREQYPSRYEELPDEHQHITDSYLTGRTIIEIGAEEGLNPYTVYSRLERAAALLEGSPRRKSVVRERLRRLVGENRGRYQMLSPSEKRMIRDYLRGDTLVEIARREGYRYRENVWYRLAEAAKRLAQQEGYSGTEGIWNRLSLAEERLEKGLVQRRSLREHLGQLREQQPERFSQLPPSAQRIVNSYVSGKKRVEVAESEGLAWKSIGVRLHVVAKFLETGLTRRMQSARRRRKLMPIIIEMNDMNKSVKPYIAYKHLLKPTERTMLKGILDWQPHRPLATRIVRFRKAYPRLLRRLRRLALQEGPLGG